MRITELLQDATIDLGVKVNSKEEAIDHLVDLMVKGGNITDREEYTTPTWTFTTASSASTSSSWASS